MDRSSTTLVVGVVAVAAGALYIAASSSASSASPKGAPAASSSPAPASPSSAPPPPREESPAASASTLPLVGFSSPRGLAAGGGGGGGGLGASVATSSPSLRRVPSALNAIAFAAAPAPGAGAGAAAGGAPGGAPAPGAPAPGGAPAPAAAAVPAGSAPAAPSHEVDISIDHVVLYDVPSLADLVPGAHAHASNARRGFVDGASSPYFNFVSPSSVVLVDIVRNSDEVHASRAFVRGGPRRELFFAPASVTAAVVTCGGLCPGLNVVVRELVETLALTYGAAGVWGVRGGYAGFRDGRAGSLPAVRLTPASVAGISSLGGTVLGSDRGGHDVGDILAFCAAKGVGQLFVVGGDGSHRGAAAVAAAAAAARVPLAVAAVPKTIDNDVDLIDRSFGFDTAVEEAQRAIRAAKVEAAGAVNGVGVVKVMGRYAGFIAAHATMASGDVDLCLVPELPLALEGPASVLEHLARVVRQKGHAVVVVAEGAGEAEIKAEDQARAAPAGAAATDAGGNRALPAIGPWLVAKIKAALTAAGVAPSIKFIDPSYMIRSVAANASDSVLCTQLAQAAVHGAMAGFTAFSTGLVNNRVCYIPIDLITATSPRRLNARGRTIERVFQLTRQPDPLAFGEYYGVDVSAAELEKKLHPGH